jgi:endonuclease YncB( thermonuclease family)
VQPAHAILTGMGEAALVFWRFVATVVSVGGWVLAAAGAATAAECEQPVGDPAVVREAVDGDTLTLADGRLVHISGIEAVKSPEADTAAARQALVELLGDGTVSLTEEVATDRYGRQHGSVLLPDGASIAEAMVAAGLARVRLLPGEAPCLPRLLKAEATARADGVGLWAGARFAVLPADSPSLGERIGLYLLVEGRVQSVGHGRSYVFLDFGRDYRRDFTIMVPLAMAARFADPLDSLNGRRIRVRGVIEESGGPAIRLRDPAEIELLDEDDGRGGGKG